ncbi:MAG: hypothetical protein AAF720_11110 [Pseudomonadota bacterium]
MDWILPCFKKEINELAYSFEENELANYALTTNVELPIRDRLAHRLNQRFAIENSMCEHIAVREWYRRDLVLMHLPSKVVSAGFELKAGYTYDPLKKTPRQYARFASDDLTKAKKKFEEKQPNYDCPVYNVLFLTHSSEIPANIPPGIITYATQINGCVKRYGSADRVKHSAKTAVLDMFSDFNVLHSGSVSAGSFLNVDVEVLFWLFKHRLA